MCENATRGSIHTSLRPCPVCGCRSGFVMGVLSYALFDDIDMPGSKTLIQCSACGMRFDDVTFTDEQLQEYYHRNEHYAASSQGGSGGSTESNQARYDRIIDALNPGPNDFILDFGCGQGGLIAQCLRRGLRGVGIEPSEKSRKCALASGLDVFDSLSAFTARNPEHKIRAVVISHVIEHLMRPLDCLREIARYAPNALVYIEVPDASSYLSLPNIRWQELYFEHLSHFHQDGIAELATNAGILITREGAIPFSQDQGDTYCLFLVGRFSAEISPHVNRPQSRALPKLSFLPEIPGRNILPDDRPLALWGVSQYAMLLIGSHPLLGKTTHLFDSSPAKIGRRIGGVEIQHPDNISALFQETVLVLPRSPYLEQMIDTLKNRTRFSGEIVIL